MEQFDSKLSSGEQFNHYIEDISGTTPGKRIVSECTTLYLGRKFYTKTVLDLYNKE